MPPTTGDSFIIDVGMRKFEGLDNGTGGFTLSSSDKPAVVHPILEAK
jgi:hypothetical protein